MAHAGAAADAAVRTPQAEAAALVAELRSAAAASARGASYDQDVAALALDDVAMPTMQQAVRALFEARAAAAACQRTRIATLTLLPRHRARRGAATAAQARALPRCVAPRHARHAAAADAISLFAS